MVVVVVRLLFVVVVEAVVIILGLKTCILVLALMRIRNGR